MTLVRRKTVLFHASQNLTPSCRLFELTNRPQERQVHCFQNYIDSRTLSRTTDANLEYVLNTLILITNPKIGRAQVILSLRSQRSFNQENPENNQLALKYDLDYDLTMTFFISSRQLEFLAKYKRQKYFLKKGKCQIQ